MSLLSRTSQSRARHAAAALILSAVGLAAPSAATAADAPLRTIGVTPGGAVTATQYPVAISPDGRLVLSNDDTTYGRTQPLLRDVAASTTTKLLSEGDRVVSASLDLAKVAFLTTRAASSKDLDTTSDLYVLDRPSGQTTLVSQDPVSGRLGQPADREDLGDALLAGDGKSVLFHSNETTFNAVPGGPTTEVHRQWRFDLTAGTLTQLSTWGEAAPDWVRQRTVDDAGRVTVTTAGIDLAGKKLPLPFDVRSSAASADVSPDGSTVAFDIVGRPTSLTLVDTATGAVSTMTLPSSRSQLSRSVWAILNGGAGAVISTYADRGAGPRTVLSRISKSGAATQLGGDIKVTDSSQLAAVSPNLQFAATSLHLAQLGTSALPGTEPNPTTPAPQALNYVWVQDTFCTRAFGRSTWTRAKAGVNPRPTGTDTRTVKGTTWRVYDTITNKTINAFSLTAGKSRDLTVPRTGGWSYDVKVTLSDNTVLSGTGKVDPHPVPECTPVLL